MAVLRNVDGTEMLIDCNCGCDNGIRFRIDKEDFDYYCFMSYTNGNFYREQNDTMWKVLCRKLKKIWAIIRNKDFHYADIVMTKDDFDKFRGYISSIN